ncbi:MAG: radical SAM protein [Planctomycetes bacterium]|nr:radical SAM protein [Planctomycetota bacterium]
MNENIKKPSIVAFEITRRCPLRCRHCRAAATPVDRVAANERSEVHGKQDFLSTRQCKYILDAVAELHKCVVVLTGGEPMVRDDIFELVEYGRSIGLRMAVATCGAMFDKLAAMRFKQAGILSLSFSLDGPDANTHDNFRQMSGAYDIMLKAIELVRAAGIRFQINTTVTALNADKLDAIAQLAINLGVACWNPFMLVPVGRAAQDKNLLLSPNQYEVILHKLADMKTSFPIELRVTCGPQFARVARQRKIAGADTVPGCLAADGFAFISHKGDVQTCGFLEISAGNLLQNGYNLIGIWQRSPLLNAVRDFSAYKAGCGKCGFLSVCRGCRARAYAHSGEVLGPDPMCIVAGL